MLLLRCIYIIGHYVVLSFRGQRGGIRNAQNSPVIGRQNETSGLLQECYK